MTQALAALLSLALLAACRTAPRAGYTAAEEEVPRPGGLLAAGSAPLASTRRLPPLPPKKDPPDDPPDGEIPETGGLKLGSAAQASTEPVKAIPLKPPEKLGAAKDKPKAGLNAGDLPKRSTSTPQGLGGLTGEKIGGAPGARPDPGGLGPNPRGSRYLSPASLADLKIGQSFEEPPAQFPNAEADPPQASPGALPDADGAPPIAALEAQPLNMLFMGNLDVASFRVQIATSPEFSKTTFDRVYDFVEDLNLNEEYLLHGTGQKAAGTPIWVRRSVIDLLGFEQPFSEPRRFTLRAKRAK